MEDRILVDAARAGDVDAFAELVRRHHRSVYRVALRIVGSEADAEDVTQETFVQAWRGLANFRGASEPSTWLYRIVTNRSLSALSRRRSTEPLDAHVALAALDSDPAHVADRRERFAQVARAVARLPGEQRAALVLRDFEGLSYEEVAEVLGVSLSAVKGRIHRARLTVMQESAGWR